MPRLTMPRPPGHPYPVGIRVRVVGPVEHLVDYGVDSIALGRTGTVREVSEEGEGRYRYRVEVEGVRLLYYKDYMVQCIDQNYKPLVQGKRARVTASVKTLTTTLGIPPAVARLYAGTLALIERIEKQPRGIMQVRIAFPNGVNVWVRQEDLQRED
jgi:hypothetical protein